MSVIQLAGNSVSARERERASEARSVESRMKVATTETRGGALLERCLHSHVSNIASIVALASILMFSSASIPPLLHAWSSDSSDDSATALSVELQLCKRCGLS